MPNARDHSLMTILGAISVGLTASMYVGARLAMIGMAAAIAGDLFLSPDLDHGSGSRAYRMWGPLRFLWWPYKRALPHRSAVSHFPLVGTAGRLLYMGILGYVVARLAGADLVAVMTAFRPECISIVAGLEFANSLHFAADKLG